MPYPSAIHWTETVTDIPWRNPPAAPKASKRPYRVVYWGSKHTQYIMSTKLRTFMIDHCLARPGICWFLQPKKRLNNPCHFHNQSNECTTTEVVFPKSSTAARNVAPTKRQSLLQQARSNIQQLQQTINHTEIILSEVTANITLPIASPSTPFPPPPTTTGISLYRQSVFCLQPPGDMEIRNGIFDALLAGCIPVLFLSHTLHKVYPWYFSAEEEEAITFHLQARRVKQKQDNIIDYLASIPDEVIYAKQEAIRNFVMRIQYALPPNRAPYPDYAGYCGGLPRQKRTAKILKRQYHHADQDHSYPIGADKESKERIREYQRRYTWKPPEEDAVDRMLQQFDAKIQRYLIYFDFLIYVCLTKGFVRFRNAPYRIPEPEELRNVSRRYDRFWKKDWY
jgi:hypothetical protein